MTFGNAWIKTQATALEREVRGCSRSPARCIHPAEPVYQVQPPRPTCGGTGIDVGGDDIGLDLVAMNVGRGCGHD